MITRSGFCCCGGLRLRLGSAIENEHQRGFAAALAFDSRILGPKHSNCQRDDFFLPKAGFIRILSPGKPGTPPCKSGQLEKDLGLEVSSARHAARLIIFEFMRSFFVGSSALVAHLPDLRYTGTNARNLRTLAISV